MRIECLPAKSPLRASRRLPGGEFKASRTAAASTIISFRRAILARFAGKPFGTLRPSRITSANFPLKFRITGNTYPAEIRIARLPGRSFAKSQSLHLPQQLPRLSQQRPYLPSLGDRIPGEQAVLARVLVCPWRAGSRCAAVHAAALSAAHRRRTARAAATGFGATTRARQHRAGISDVIAHACSFRLASAASRPRLEPAGFAARAADAEFLSDTITLACC